MKVPWFSSVVKVLQDLARTSYTTFGILTRGRAQLSNSPTRFWLKFLLGYAHVHSKYFCNQKKEKLPKLEEIKERTEIIDVV